MIDWSRACQLLDEVGAEDFEEVVELFLEEVEAVTSKLEAANTPDTLGEDLHFLKGSALSLGFAAFSQLCHAGEIAAEEGRADTVNVAEILTSYEKSKAVFLAEYHERLAA